MKYEIKNKSTGEVQFIADIDCDKNESQSVKKGLAVRWALENRGDLKGADLREADLKWANLEGANLEYANLDFSCLPLWCGSLKANMDDKQVSQILYHLLSIVKNSNKVSDKRKKHLLTKKLLKIANDSHVVSEYNREEL